MIKAYSYQLVPYLIKDNPELSATETITLSRQLMHGHKGGIMRVRRRSSIWRSCRDAII